MPYYDIKSIPLEAREDTESLGSKPKFWVLLGDERWLFKESRPNTGEDWSEKAAADIAHALGIDAAYVELAEYAGKVGCISRNFIDVDAGEALEHGNEVMARTVTGYDKTKKLRQAAAKDHPAHFNPAIERVADLDSQILLDIFERLPPERATETARQFAKTMVCITRTALIDILK